MEQSILGVMSRFVGLFSEGFLMAFGSLFLMISTSCLESTKRFPLFPQRGYGDY
jgi:hypothetical protein